MKRLFAFALIVALSLPGYTQEMLHDTVDVELVNVYLSAMDKNGRFVTDLQPEELLLKEDGVPQTITHFTNFAKTGSEKLGEAGVPLTVAILIDISTSMGTGINGKQLKIDIVKNAAFRILDELRPEDKVMLITFHDRPQVITPLGYDVKQTRQDLLFEDVRFGNTALLDSIYFGLEKIQNDSGRKIIIVCSDGDDTASKLRFDEVLANLVASDVTVLAFGTMALSSNNLRGHYTLQKLAEASGGLAFFPGSFGELEAMMERLREGMRSQYSLGFKPDPLKHSAWRKIEISSKRPGLKLRYREGYSAK